MPGALISLDGLTSSPAVSNSSSSGGVWRAAGMTHVESETAMKCQFLAVASAHLKASRLNLRLLEFSNAGFNLLQKINSIDTSFACLSILSASLLYAFKIILCPK
jgi:hypothetical protein